eukprot:scaffold781_cov123-Isochrysis_galbana.AAC.4
MGTGRGPPEEGSAHTQPQLENKINGRRGSGEGRACPPHEAGSRRDRGSRRRLVLAFWERDAAGACFPELRVALGCVGLPEDRSRAGGGCRCRVTWERW